MWQHATRCAAGLCGFAGFAGGGEGRSTGDGTICLVEEYCMKRLVLLVMVAIVALVFSAPMFAQDAAKIAQGEKVYAREKCSMCHSIAGKGNKKFPLDGVGTKLKADAIQEWMVSPKTAAAKAKSTATPMMKAYEKMSKEDLEAVVAYMLSLKS